ncbi:hypothetical protein WP50_24910, partial [Lactiplantibacillus plantarum]
GDLITAKFGNQIKKTRVDHEGRWQMKCFSGNGHLMVTETNAYDDIPGHTETVINNGTPRTDATSNPTTIGSTQLIILLKVFIKRSPLPRYNFQSL